MLREVYREKSNNRLNIIWMLGYASEKKNKTTEKQYVPIKYEQYTETKL